MWEELFSKPSVIARHKKAPHREEREQYLAHLARQGYALGTRRLIARELLWIVRKMHISPQRRVTLEQIQVTAQNWTHREHEYGQKLNTRWTSMRFIQIARGWFRFMGQWNDPKISTPFDGLVDEFCLWMERERGLTKLTIHRRRVYLKQFLMWFAYHHRPLAEVRLDDIDAYLSFHRTKGCCRTTVSNMARALRVFFRYAGFQGWCASSIAPGIQGPRVFGQEQLPSGPSWQDVKRLIASTLTERKSDIRDRALILLFAIYGFRSMEVSSLRVDDVDWQRNLLSVSRAKRREKQTYPLIHSVGEAIIRYLREVRPQCSRREMFLTMLPPFRPLSREGLRSVVGIRMKRLGIRSTRYGPHALRHSCATHLLSEGFSLKEIGDHLGHKSTSATRIYAKVDLKGLREIAAFNLGGLL